MLNIPSINLERAELFRNFRKYEAANCEHYHGRPHCEPEVPLPEVLAASTLFQREKEVSMVLPTPLLSSFKIIWWLVDTVFLGKKDVEYIQGHVSLVCPALLFVIT